MRINPQSLSSDHHLRVMAELRDLLAAAHRMLPSMEMMDLYASSPDDERIHLLTSWSAVRQLAAVVAKIEGAA